MRIKAECVGRTDNGRGKFSPAPWMPGRSRTVGLIRGAEPGSQQAVWAGESGPAGVQLLGVWTEKRAGLGEDAEPTLLLRQSTAAGLIGVYDGMGGAGARVLGHTGDGRPVSHAYAASRLAHLAVQQWYVSGREQSLADRLREVLEAARPVATRKLRGTITKQLPTTMALIEFAPPATAPGVRITARWAGDSRCYLLSPRSGLRQISWDDSAVNDPLETLKADQPLTNHLAAGTAFQLNEKRLERDRAGCVLLCATDGFFGYVASPAMFEYQLLDTLNQAADLHEWGALMADWRRRTAGDDATLALAALGFADFGDLRARFTDRLHLLHREHAQPLAELTDPDEQLDGFRRESWARYRDEYTRFMPGRPM
jgi:serine/threonine protein phosphatase PrpC